MPSGRPDWFGTIVSAGKYDDTYIAIAVDIYGNLIGLMKGDDDGILRTIALDSGGRIVSVIRDPTSDQYIAVDSAGNITATMKGDYSGTLKTIAVDSTGIMKANLSAQDLDFLTVRPAYGQAQVESGSKNVNASTTESAFTITGRGVILSGYVYWAGPAIQRNAVVQLWVDDVNIYNAKPGDMHSWHIFDPSDAPITLTRFDDDNFWYKVSFRPITTFESKLEVKFENIYAGMAMTFYYNLIYALVP